MSVNSTGRTFIVLTGYTKITDLPFLTRVPTVGRTLLLVIGTTIAACAAIAISCVSRPVATDALTVDPNVAFTHATHIKCNRVVPGWCIEVSLRKKMQFL